MITNIRNYRDLIVWQKAMDLVEMVYMMTKSFPKEEIYGLSIQVRRAAVSIPSNIAEGQGRRSTPEFRRFLSIALGSTMEVETQIQIARRLSYVTNIQEQEVLEKTQEIQKMLYTLRKKLTNPN